MDHLNIVNEIMTVEEGSKGEYIRSFLLNGDFCPCLVVKGFGEASPENSDNAGDGRQRATLRIGDVRRIGTTYELEGVGCAEDLHEHILTLGELYMYARRLRLEKLVDKIVLKLQVAWNSYQGVAILGDFLAVARDVFDPNNVAASFDGMQNWLISFMADTMQIYQYKYGKEFFLTMQDYPVLRNAVFDKYAEKLRENPERYADPRVWLRSRGIEI
jgi:hypothetical protein